MTVLLTDFVLMENAFVTKIFRVLIVLLKDVQMIAQKMEYVILLHINVFADKDFQVKNAARDLVLRTVEGNLKAIAIMENASVLMALQDLLVILKLALIHVQITENALKVNANVNQDIKV